MKNNKTLAFILWVLFLAIGMLFLCMIPKTMNATSIALIIFTLVIFLGQLILWLMLSKEGSTKEKTFLNLPVYMYSIYVMIIQLAVDILCSFFAERIPIKLVIFVEIIFLVVQCIIIVMSLITKNSIEKLDSRQKNHHIEL